MNGHNLVLRFDGYTETGIKAFGRLERQLLFIGDHITDIIGQATVGIGHKARTLKHHDLGLLIQSADTCRGGGTACHAPHNDNLHLDTPFAYCFYYTRFVKI